MRLDQEGHHLQNQANLSPDSFDFIVAGGGTAGCVLASRLSADPRNRVLLIEAGRDFPRGAEPDLIASARFRSHQDPALFATHGNVDVGPLAPQKGTFRVPQVIGGGSSVNGMHAQRGLAEDYDNWAAFGVSGWGWKDVLPYFRRLETDLDFPNANHGDRGPIHIRRVQESQWSPLSRAIAGELNLRGVPRHADLVAAQGDCVASVPLNVRADRRASVTSSYLGPEVRQRSNLFILECARVERLLVTAARVIGVEVRVAGHLRPIRAQETILSLGVVGSPLLLLRSGIGPAEQLLGCGIAVQADRRGVGRSLRNHVHLSLGAHLNRPGRQSAAAIHPCTMVARYSSHVHDCPASDMMLNVWERSPGPLSWDPLSRQFAVLMILLNSTFSVGSLQLDPRAPHADACLRFNILDDPRDLDRMVRGVSLINTLLRSAAVSPLVDGVFLPTPNTLSTLLNKNNWQSTAVSVAGALALSGPRALRQRILRAQGVPLSSIMHDADGLRDAVAAHARPASHATSTCRMGDRNDRDAVTDSRCRAIGLSGLRVVDCSIFPTTLRAGTHIPAIMAAEKAAQMIMEDCKGSAMNAATC